MTIEEIYRENYPVVYGYLLALSGQPQLAEDIASEVFLKAIRKIHTYDGSCKPSTWLCAIGRNLYYNERKWQKRHVPLEEARFPVAVSPEETCIDRDIARQILSLAVELPEVQRQVFFMRLTDLSFREIGGAFGKSENWARVTYFRAKEKIVERMGEL